MSTSVPSPQRRLPVWPGVALWLSAFFSPTIYFLVLLLARGSEVPSPLKPVIVLLCFLVPIMALLICEIVVWRSRMTLVWKVGWMLFTLIALLLQFGMLAVILRAILIAATGYAQ